MKNRGTSRTEAALSGSAINAERIDIMDATSFAPPVIGALVVRHAGDAAFYWSQLDWTLQSPTVGFERLRHFNRLLEAHLDGLEVAGTRGWKISFDALECWQKPGEAFVCASLALRSLDSDRLEEFLASVCRRPDQLVRAAVSALAACAPQPFMEIARRWSAIDAPPPAQVIVLRAVALRGRGNAPHLAETLQTYLQSEESDIRAAACRACRSTAQADEIILALQNAVSDPDLQVRAEAAIALGQLGQANAAHRSLYQSVLAQAGLYSGASGALRAQASRRLQRWTRELAWLTPIGDPDASEILVQLPPRIALSFALWHGDLTHLPFVIDQLADKDIGRYAGWVWQTLTGIDLNASGLALAEPDPASPNPNELITETRLDADSGHPQADQAAVKAATAASPHLVSRGKRVLLGREIDARTALELLENAPQAIRAMAAQVINRAQSTVHINVRASTTEQTIAMNALHDMFTPKAAA